MKLIDLIHHLRQPMLRLRTGLWLVPADLLGQELNYILGLPVGCDVIDLRQAVINFRPTSAPYAAITPEHIHTWLDQILEKDIQHDVAVLTQLDLLLAALGAGERQAVWQILLNSFARRSKALIFAIPQRAVGSIITELEIQAWQQNERLASNQSSTTI